MNFFRHKHSPDGKVQEWELFLRAHGCPEKEIASTAEKLNQLPEDLQAAALQWGQTGTVPDIEAEGFTARELNEVFGFKEIACILMLGWLRRAPDEAKYALSRPYSRVAVDQETIEALRRAEAEDSGEDKMG